MIALKDDFNQSKVTKKKNTNRTKRNLQTLLYKMREYRDKRKRRRMNRLALNQLMQLDDALLKDIGIQRSDLDAVRNRTLSFDSLVKHEINAARDHTGVANLPNKRIQLLIYYTVRIH